MFHRVTLVVALAFLPLTALADSTTATGPTASSQLSQPQASSSSLGPSSGGSTGDATALQPAGTSPLQSTTSDSSGLTAPDSSYLQEPATTDNTNLQVMLGDGADGGPQQLPGSGPNYWAWLFVCLLAALIAAVVTWIVRTRRRSALLSPAGPELPVEVDLPDVGDADRDPVATVEPPADIPDPEPGPIASTTTDNTQVSSATGPKTTVDSSQKHAPKIKKSKKQKRRHHK